MDPERSLDPSDTETETILERLHEATNEVTAAPSLTECTARAVEAGTDVLGFDQCLLAEAVDEGFEVVATAGETAVTVGDRPPTFGEDVVATAFQSGEPAVGTPSEEDDGRQVLAVPVGEWGIFQTVGTGFDRADLRRTELLVSPLATTLERIETETRLRKRTKSLERQTRQIEALHAMSTEMKTAATREEIYERYIAAVEEIVEIDMCVLNERDGDVLTPIAVGSTMDIEDYYTEIDLGNEQSIAARTYGQRGTILIDSLEQSEYRAAREEYQSLISVPLDDWGVFQAAASEESAFDETDRRLVELLADATEAAIDRIDREQELQQRTERLQRQNNRLDQFATVISHDLRNPLNVAMLHLSAELQKDDNEALEMGLEALERMETMISDMLTLARAETAVGETESATLVDLAREAWETVETDDATLAFDHTETATIECDRSLLKNVFENLFRNAVEHNESPVTVRVGTLEESGFYIEDDGGGIPPEDREEVFNYGHTSRENGTGLGLSIVTDLVDAHGWDIDVTAGREGGARFEVDTRDDPDL